MKKLERFIEKTPLNSIIDKLKNRYAVPDTMKKVGSFKSALKVINLMFDIMIAFTLFASLTADSNSYPTPLVILIGLLFAFSLWISKQFITGAGFCFVAIAENTCMVQTKIEPDLISEDIAEK